MSLCFLNLKAFLTNWVQTSSDEDKENPMNIFFPEKTRHFGRTKETPEFYASELKGLAGNFENYNLDCRNIDCRDLNAKNLDCWNLDSRNLKWVNLDCGKLNWSNLNSWNLDFRNLDYMNFKCGNGISTGGSSTPGTLPDRKGWGVCPMNFRGAGLGLARIPFTVNFRAQKVGRMNISI